MKIRESGMPEETFWESFFNTEEIFPKLKLDKTIYNVAEFGSGYGTFTIPAARIIKENIYAFDIDPAMINILKQKIKKDGLANIKLHQVDFAKEGTPLEDNEVDYVMMFNILHGEDPGALLKEANRILKPNARIGVIHWVYSESTPRGPSLDIRPRPEQCIEWLQMAGFAPENNVIALPPYHYGLIGIKQ